MLWPLIAISPIASGPSSTSRPSSSGRSASSRRPGSARRSSRPAARSPYGVKRRDRRGLRQAVALEDRDAEPLLELLVHLDRQRRAAGDGDPQVRRRSSSTSTSSSSSAPSRPQYIVGTPAKNVTLLALHQLPAPALGLEARQQHDACRRSANAGVLDARSGRTSGTAAARTGRCRGRRRRRRTARSPRQRVVAHVAVRAARRPWAGRWCRRCRGSPRCRRSSVCTRLERPATARAIAGAERLGALDRRRRGRVGRDHEEVLAAVGLPRSPAWPSCAIGSSAVPSKQKYAFASESSRW